MSLIPVCKPTVDEQTIQELNDVIRSGWLGNGPKVKEFETKFAEYTGAKYAIATNSGTAALDLCLKAAGISGGELITTPMTFVSDALVGEFNNMDVTFADIHPRTLCLDPETLNITDQTKAIIAVDLHGRLADIDGIRAKIGNRDILIIEDAAHAMYTPGVGKGDLTMFSFQAVKTMPIGDGGMIITDNEVYAKRIKELYWLGVIKSTWERNTEAKYTWDYDITHTGIKGYMTDIQAVIGIGQLRRLDEMLTHRRAIQEKYNQAFNGYDWFRKPVFSYTVQYYTPEFDNRDGLGEFLAKNRIATSVHFKPLSEMTYWKKAVKNPLPNTEVWRKLLSLPCHNALTDEQQDYIIEKVKEFYQHD